MYVFNESNVSSELRQHSLTPIISQVEPIQFSHVPNIKDKLQQWVLESNTSKNNVNKLLKVLKSEGLNVPLDVRTLLSTPRSNNTII